MRSKISAEFNGDAYLQDSIGERVVKYLVSANNYIYQESQLVPGNSSLGLDFVANHNIEKTNNVESRQNNSTDIVGNADIFTQNNHATVLVDWESFKPHKEPRISPKEKVEIWLNKIAYLDVSYDGKTYLCGSITKFEEPFTVPEFNEVMIPINLSYVSRAKSPSDPEWEDLLSQQRTYLTILDYETEAEVTITNSWNETESSTDRFFKRNNLGLLKNLVSNQTHSTGLRLFESAKQRGPNSRGQNHNADSKTIVKVEPIFTIESSKRSRLRNRFLKLRPGNLKHVSRGFK